MGVGGGREGGGGEMIRVVNFTRRQLSSLVLCYDDLQGIVVCSLRPNVPVALLQPYATKKEAKNRKKK